MRRIFATGLLLLAAGCSESGHPGFDHGPPAHRGRGGHSGWRDGGDRAGNGAGNGAGGPSGRLFISPMGEPFRSPRGGVAPQDMWFDQADVNHDGALSREEFLKDASRFFAVLDRGHDGEIDPEDIDYYETVLAPEIRVAGAGAGGGMRAGRGGSGGGGGGHRGGGMGGAGRRGGGGMGGGSGERGGDSGESNEGETRPSYVKQGAARFGFFDFPEPVTVADTNLNRGVDPAEFERAANDRFDMLDRNHDGVIQRGELPRIAPAPGGGPGRGRERRNGEGARDDFPAGGGDGPPPGDNAP